LDHVGEQPGHETDGERDTEGDPEDRGDTLVVQ
jgi:hypothetical protein